jgi:N6-adenosine-specific RNA methylase IME4
MYLWANQDDLGMSIDLLKHWGFEAKDVLVWEDEVPPGKMYAAFKFTQHSRCTHRLLIIGTKGTPEPVEDVMKAVSVRKFK